ncbi:MAG: alpha/beta hydrolase [Chitinophagaceae bacterium]|nr:alpha/beta hydrolase [Chitinophagaceae bacterium]
MQSNFLKKITTVGMAVSTLFFASCNDNNSNSKTAVSDSTAMNVDTTKQMGILKPKGPKPDWAPDMTPEMQVVIEKLMSYNSPPLITLSAADARKQPSPANAVKDVMKDNNVPMPTSMVDTVGKDIPVTGGNIHLRIYSPKGNGPFPVIVYYHGGGWVIADLDTYDASARGLAEQTGAVLVSVAYRQAPEHKFPTAHNDSYAAYEWVLKNTASIKGDVKHVALVGESAGGNLAAAVSMMARDKGMAIPVYQVLVYPIAGYDTATASYQKNAMAKPLDRPLMVWFFNNYLNNPADGKNPMISLVNAKLKGMPPTTIITAQYDPLQSDGEMLSDKLKAAGVTVNYKMYNGVTHEFFGMATVVPAAKEAQAMAASDLKSAFGK